MFHTVMIMTIIPLTRYVTTSDEDGYIDSKAMTKQFVNRSPKKSRTLQ